MKSLTRLIPYVTLASALVAVLVGNLGLIALSVADQVMIGLIALVAVDALAERMAILQRIEGFMLGSRAVSGLRPRADIPRPDVFANGAATIDIWAVSAVSIIAQHRNFYRERLDQGCKIRVILLDPTSDTVSVHARQSLADADVIAMHIRSAMSALAQLLEKRAPQSGSMELRLIPVFAPFSLIAADLAGPKGRLVTEFHTYRMDLDTRAHVILEAETHRKWFQFFRSQFEAAWNDSRPVSREDVAGLLRSSTPLGSQDRQDRTEP